ncbi:Glycosyltransferase, GT2 family [Lachnospiraceae bacterium KH1T2]|nr:Glycosyltransferase, GT2 family [Lachnospiraceae bacterium KH1T2]
MSVDVSIILPTYNGEKYIKEAIESVLSQTYTNWELIIVDDGSVDSTYSIAEIYSLLDNRISVVKNKENMKLPKTLNIGFGLAKGKYWTWISDDNIFYSNAISEMVMYLDKNPKCPLVYATVDVMNAEGEKIGSHGIHRDEYLYYDCSVTPCFMYRREVAENVGEYDEDLFCLEDWDFFLRILRKYGFFGHINEIMYSYRIHDGGLSQSHHKRIRRMFAEYRKKNIEWIGEGLANSPELLCRMYLEFYWDGYVDQLREIRSQFVKYCPELFSISENVRKDCDFVVYGAGYYGSLAVKLIGKNKIKFFIDRNTQLTGKTKMGIEIKGIDNLDVIAEKYNVIIAVSSDKIYEVLKDFYKWKVKQCYLFQILEVVGGV